MIEIFIPGNVSSSKNGQTWTGKYLIHGKTTKRYIMESKEYYNKYSSIFRQRLELLTVQPYRPEFTFIRDSRRKFDYINAQQIVQDLMVRCCCLKPKACISYKSKPKVRCPNSWLADDNADILLPVFIPYQYDKHNPGVLIRV